jgi:FkbM family methyltransferase
VFVGEILNGNGAKITFQPIKYKDHTVFLTKCDIPCPHIDEIYLAQKSRFHFYAEGFTHHLLRLETHYNLNHVLNVKDGDTVIDVGANIGEIGLYYRYCGININYIPIEPALLEASCCALNNKCHVYENPVWHELTQLPFYDKNDTGDSSLLELEEFYGQRTVQTMTLESLFEKEKIEHVKLLKADGEGAEPEILLGAEKILNKIEYITIDLGAERGLQNETTIVPVINYLLKRNFEIITYFHIPTRSTFLFKNLAF